VTGRLDKVDTCVNPVVDQLCPVDPVLLFEISIEPSLDVVDDRFPAADEWTKSGIVSRARRQFASVPPATYESSLLMKSPYPGVSTTVNLNLTPFSSISIQQHLRSDQLPRSILLLSSLTP
jgi:hypothetical protein